MEESKRKEIKSYIDSQVDPIIRPLVEEIVRKRPSNIVSFINEYSFKLISNSIFIKVTKTQKKFTLTQKKKTRNNRLLS